MHRPALLVLLLILSGCAVLRAYPDRATNVDEELKALDAYLRSDAITKYESTNESDRGGLTRQAWRNRVVYARLRAIDLHFNTFQQQLFEQGVGFGVATDWVVLGLNAAGSVTTGGAVNALAATSAGVVGAKAAFDKNAYFEKTMPVLVATMVAKRKEVLVRLREGLTKSDEEYPLTLALNDLETYYNAGTIPGAIVDVAETAGGIAKTADEDLKHVAVVKPVPAELQVRRENMADYVKTLQPNQLDQLAKALDVRTGPMALPDILTKIATAESPEVFNPIAQKVRVLFGKEF